MSAEPRYALRRAAAVLSALIILIVAIGVPMALIAPVPQASARVADGLGTTTARATPRFPGFGHAAVGAVGMPGVLAVSGDQSPRPMASITKVITALVVLERHPLGRTEQGPTLRFTARDEGYLQDVLAQGGSWQQVQAGWKLTERQALETMLIPSANNYAESLAVWTYGSVPRYLTAARAYLKRHGLMHTTLVDSNGLGNGDRSTPGDLVALGKLALASPAVKSVVSMASATEPQIGDIENTNNLLGDGGVDGIKTGTTDQAGACLLFAAPARVGTRKVQLVGVIMGAKTHPQLDATVLPLLKSIRAGLHEVPLARRGQVFATYRTAWGGIARAVAAKDAFVLVWSRTAVRAEASASPIRGGTRGEPVGRVTFHVAGRTAEVPLALDRSVLAAPFWWRLTHPLR